MTIKRKRIAIILALSLGLNSFPIFAEDYRDISTHWAKNSINEFQTKGYINGYDEYNFLPNKQITRAEFISILNKSLELTGKKEVDFKDVSKDSWFYEQLSIALYNGYISGYNDKTFRPQEPITRAEVCVIMARLNKLPSILTEDNDKEIQRLQDVPKWARESVKSLVNANIISGYNDKSLAVDKNMSRAEAVVVLDKFKTVEENSKKDVIISSLDEIPKNTIIVSNLIIAEELAKEPIKLENVKIGGKLIINGSGDKQLTILSCDIRGDLQVNRQNANLVFSGDTKVKNVVLQKDATLSAKNLNTSIDKITVSKDFSGKEVNILLPAKNLEVFKNTEINIKENIKNVEISSNAQQAKLFVSDDKKIENIKSENKINLAKESEKSQVSKSNQQSNSSGNGGSHYSSSSSSSNTSETNTKSNEQINSSNEENKQLEKIKEDKEVEKTQENNQKDIQENSKEEKDMDKKESLEKDIDKKESNKEENISKKDEEKPEILEKDTDKKEEKPEGLEKDVDKKNEDKVDNTKKENQKNDIDVNQTTSNILIPKQDESKSQETPENKDVEDINSQTDNKEIPPKIDNNDIKKEQDSEKSQQDPKKPEAEIKPPKKPSTNKPKPQVLEKPKTKEEIMQEEDKKADLLISRLSSAKNSNLAKYINEDGKVRVIFWTKGITPPVMGDYGKGGDFVREDTKVEDEIRYSMYRTIYEPGNKWYDTNKSRIGGNTEVDRNLCFGSVAANMLHWWLEQNSEYVNRYINKLEKENILNDKVKQTPLVDIRHFINSYKDQQNSGIFEMFKTHFGNNTSGYYSDILIDFFINGFAPKPNGGTNDGATAGVDERAGFFYDVFGNSILTYRAYSGNYDKFSNYVKTKLSNGEIMGIEHKTGAAYTSHIVTFWGAEFDVDGNITGVYITDSDDQDYMNGRVGMRRYDIRNKGGKPIMSTNVVNKLSGSEIDFIHSLSLAEDKWEEYFQKNPN